MRPGTYDAIIKNVYIKDGTVIIDAVVKNAPKDVIDADFVVTKSERQSARGVTALVRQTNA